MTFEEFNKRKGRPLKNLIAIRWVNTEFFKGFQIPERFWTHRDLERGKNCIGEVQAVGREAKELQPKDLVIFHEYERKGDKMYLDDQKIYFIPEEFIFAKVDEIPRSIF